MSTPRPFHYCRVCYRNFTDYEWKKHRFNPRHKQRLEDKLASVEVALEHLLSPTDDVTAQDLEFDVASFECYFCEDYSPLKNIEEEGDDNTRPNVYVYNGLARVGIYCQLFLIFFAFSLPIPHRSSTLTLYISNVNYLCSTTLWKHLAGKKHKQQVQQYFADYTPPPLYQPQRYWLKKALLKYKLGLFVRACRARDHDGGLHLTAVTRDTDQPSEARDAPNTLTHTSDSVSDSSVPRGKCQSVKH